MSEWKRAVGLVLKNWTTLMDGKETARKIGLRKFKWRAFSILMVILHFWEYPLR